MPPSPASEDILTNLQSMDNYEFEHLIADLWERQGWETTVTQSSNDAGIDVVATKDLPVTQKALIQAKRYGPGTTVGGPAIQQYSSLKHQEDSVDSVIVITSNRFSRQAQNRARELNVKTVNGDELVELIKQLDADDLIEDLNSPDYEDAQMKTASTSVEPQGDLSSGDKKDSSDFSWREISPDTYLRFIQGGTIIWSIGFFLGIIGYSGGAFGSLLGIAAIVCWIMFPPALYYEAERVSEATPRTLYGTLYAIGGAIPFLNALVGGIYLYRRRQAYRAITTEKPISTERSKST